MSVLNFLKSVTGKMRATAVTVTDPLPVALHASGAAVAFGWSTQLITTKTTTLVKSGAGTIGVLDIEIAGTADTILVYDGLTAAGTLIGSYSAPTVGRKFLEGVNFAVGLCIVTGGTTAGTYRVSYA